MQTVPIFRFAHLQPYLKFLRDLGAPVDRELNRVKLPTHLPEDSGAYFPTIPVLAFLENMSYCEGLDELGLRAVNHINVNDLNRDLLAVISGSLTLNRALHSFRRLVSLEDASLKIYLIAEDTASKICIKHCVKAGPLGQRNAEWTQLLVIIEIIRLFSGLTWSPQKMGFAANLPLSGYAYEQFPDTQLYINQLHSWIEIPNHMLSLRPLLPSYAQECDLTCLEEQLPGSNFSAAIKSLLKTYLHDSSVGVRELADLIGMSARSLQRSLSNSATSFSELLNETRIEKSIELLKNTDSKIIDIALSTGYNDPSHFSRAFRRLTGVSPRDYRKRILAPS